MVGIVRHSHSENFRKLFPTPSRRTGAEEPISTASDASYSEGQAHGKPIRNKWLSCLGAGVAHLHRESHAPPRRGPHLQQPRLHNIRHASVAASSPRAARDPASPEHGSTFRGTSGG